jgi:ADP-ribose pyrophosphatase YjhB (NUDIX family)
MSQSEATARQVAVVAVRRGHDGVDVCLIRRKGSAKWAIPKGFIDRGDTPESFSMAPSAHTNMRSGVLR